MTINTSATSGVDNTVYTGELGDVQKRVNLYDRIQSWKSALPKQYRPEDNFTFQSCFLRYELG